MRSESQKVMQGYNVGWDLEPNTTTLNTANSVRGWADITRNKIRLIENTKKHASVRGLKTEW